jgi:hypothetical protein
MDDAKSPIEIQEALSGVGPCSAWLGELEAALRTAEKLRDEAQRERGSLNDYARLDGICIVLEYALNAERSRSPSKELCGGASQSASATVQPKP